LTKVNASSGIGLLTIFLGSEDMKIQSYVGYSVLTGIILVVFLIGNYFRFGPAMLKLRTPPETFRASAAVEPSILVPASNDLMLPKRKLPFNELYKKYAGELIRVEQVPWVPHSPPIVDILVRTWHGDGHWLAYLLRSVEQFMDPKSYRQIVLIYNSPDDKLFQSYIRHYKLPIKMIPVYDNPQWLDTINHGGYNAQLYSKMLPHTYTDADYFINLDSDCLLTKPVNISHFMDDQGRVYVKRELFSERDPHKRIWQAPSEYMLKFPVPYETMTRFPMTFPRDLYENLLKHISANHKNLPVIAVMQEMEITNEFTPLGAYLITEMPGRWVDLPVQKDNILVQGWSWGGLKPGTVAYYECLLRAVNQTECQQV
jgi:hypothetical protein